MKFKISLVATLISTVLCVPASAEDQSFHKRLYAGAAGGISQLQPEVENGVDLRVTDDESTGGKVFVGWDFHPHLGVELGYADLGEAEIGTGAGVTVGDLGYEVADLSVLYHFYNAGGYDRLLARRGLGAFLKIGVGTMDNSSDLEFTRDNDTHLMGGAGLEYGTKVGLALRGEIEAFDEDAILASLGLLWRLGGNKSSDNDHGGLFSEADSGNTVAAIAAPVSDDNDSDGVPNSLDDCPGTESGEPVTATGCAMFGGVLDGLLFESSSDTLTDSAQVVLNDAADVLLKHPDSTVEIQAHTDSSGAADYNLDLSKRRALATVRYLMLRGVPSEQLLARAFGESKPLEDNATPAGRSANRRVEFHVTK